MAHEKKARGMWRRSETTVPVRWPPPLVVVTPYGVCQSCREGKHDQCLACDLCECPCNRKESS